MLNRADDDSRWDERIARARQLATQCPTAAELLIFYAALAEYQQSLLDFTRVTDPLPPAPGPPEGGRHRGYETKSRSFFEVLDLEPVLAAIPDCLSWLSHVAPVRLSKSAAEMRRIDRAEWRHLAHSYVAGNDRGFEEADEMQVFVLEALLQPFAEQLAIRIANAAAAAGASRIPNPQFPIPNPDTRSPTRCPICGGLPVVGVLREEGHGAKRTLVCARCLIERDYPRVVCPACGKQQVDALPVYTANQFAHVRIEACDGCRRYLKTIDLTKDGLAVPVVDDVASVSLDLWAREQGYTRLRSNLLKL